MVKNDLVSQLSKYAVPRMARSIGEVIISLIVFSLFFALTAYAYYYNLIWLWLISAIFQGMAYVRIFVLHHDCGHLALFKTIKQNRIIGTILAFITFTSHDYWAIRHSLHHAGSGNLDKRGIGDIDLLTIPEYSEADKKHRLLYRFIRNPFILIFFGGLWQFWIEMRFLRKDQDPNYVSLIKKRHTRLNIWLTNITLLLVYGAFVYFFGFKALLMIVLIPFWISSIFGVLLFYVQHNFEETYFRDSKEWNYHDASLQGSSYFKLPWLLRWFSANIGYHHIHHYNMRIPFYNLPICFEQVVEMQHPIVITLSDLPRHFGVKLYNTQLGKLVKFVKEKLK